MTPRQKDLYDFLLAWEGWPVSPSYEEMAEGIGVVAKSAVHKLVKALAREGYIKHKDGRWRSITLASRHCPLCKRSVPPDWYFKILDEDRRAS